MNLKGRLVHSIGAEKQILIQQALITPERIALDWTQDTHSGRLIAKSPNGSHFSGRYSVRTGKADFECDLTLYKGAYEDLLYGAWRDPATSATGTLILRLPSGSVETHAPADEEGRAGALAAAPRSLSPAESFPETTSPQAHSRQATSPETTLPAPAPSQAAIPPAAAGDPFEYLLAISSEQFAEQNASQIEQELAAAPMATLFELARHASAAELRAIAVRLFAQRYGDLPAAGGAAAPKTRPAESPESRAQKRRSSRHKQRR